MMSDNLLPKLNSKIIPCSGRLLCFSGLAVLRDCYDPTAKPLYTLQNERIYRIVHYLDLIEVIKCLISDNYGSLADRKTITWDWSNTGWNLSKLDRQAETLSPEEKELIAAGEHTEVEALVEAKDVRYLNDFLAEVFDGKLSPNFMPRHGIDY